MRSSFDIYMTSKPPDRINAETWLFPKEDCTYQSIRMDLSDRNKTRSILTVDAESVNGSFTIHEIFFLVF